MIPLPDRQHAVLIIHEAISSGCGVAKACHEAGIDRRTLRRWTAAGDAQVIMIIDIWSRKIVGHEVYASETGELAAQLFDHTVLS
jgi:transposase InsO family protein